MPARPTRTPGTAPGWFARFCLLPQGEIHRFLLAFIYFHPGSSQHVINSAAGQFAITGKSLDPKIDISLDFIGESSANEPLHRFNDIRYMFADPGVYISSDDAQRISILKVLLDIALGQEDRIIPLFPGPVDYLVIDIREVLHIFDLVAPVFQVPPDRIEYYQGAGIAQVDIIIGGRPAHIHFYLARIKRYQLFFVATQGIVHFHPGAPPSSDLPVFSLIHRSYFAS